jgi:hypothetical protein
MLLLLLMLLPLLPLLSAALDLRVSPCPCPQVLAVRAGADAIVVSNHGGRHVTFLPMIQSTID